MLSGPLCASKEGYDLFTGTVPMPKPPDTVSSLDIRLTRGADSATVRGRVLLDGVPVAGVPVGMDFTSLVFRSSTLKTRGGDRPDPVPVLGKSMLTDANGMYEMTGLAPGFYTVEAGYLPDDGYATAWTQRWRWETSTSAWPAVP
jgi:hypothetical protein